jgi:hypothetical protein
MGQAAAVPALLAMWVRKWHCSATVCYNSNNALLLVLPFVLSLVCNMLCVLVHVAVSQLQQIIRP